MPDNSLVVRLVAAVLALGLMAGACSSDSEDRSSSSTSEAPSGAANGPGPCTDDATAGPDAETVAGIVEAAMQSDDLHAALYRVTRGDEVIAAGSVGESLPGQPVTPDMHFRGGNVAFAYMGTLLLLMAESGEVSLDDPISRWLPDLDVPEADTVTLSMLVRNTSGYPDYVRSDSFVDPYLADPFASFTPEQLIEIGLSTPVWYPPGTGWSYAHTNYMILGEALAAAGGKPLGELLTERVIEPMGLGSTMPLLDTDVPEPVLQTYSTERGVFENTTWWNPSWQTAPGSVLGTDICDLATSARAVGRGDLLTDESLQEMLSDEVTALPPPPPSCPPDVCRVQSESLYYGMGVLVMEGWIVQRPLFGGYGAVQAYLPDADLAVAVVAVSGKDSEAGVNHAQPIWLSIAEALTPGAVPST